MVKLYHYVGPAEIHERACHSPHGVRLTSVADLREWVRSTGQRSSTAGLISVTFVIDQGGSLLVADRASEHVACSGRRPVLSAGEMFLRVEPGGVEVAEVSNQSTGFCPEPGSWPAVSAALDRLGIRHPGRFTQEITFRRCPACGERNVVKDGWLTCGVCEAELPTAWNF